MAAGAVSVNALPLHLRPGVREHFLGWLRAARPDLVADYERRCRARDSHPGFAEYLAASEHLIVAQETRLIRAVLVVNASVLALYLGCALAAWRLRQMGVEGGVHVEHGLRVAGSAQQHGADLRFVESQP